MDLYQAFHNATFQDKAFKDHAIDLLSLAINPTHVQILPPQVNQILYKLFRYGEVAFNMTQTYRDLDYTVTKHAHLAIAHDSCTRFMLFTYDDTFYYDNLSDLCDILKLTTL